MTNEKGWIPLERSITEHWVWSLDEVFSKFQAWMDILLSVNYKPKQIPFGEKVITVGSGCMLTSALKLSKRWGWDRKTVSKFLKRLENSGSIKCTRIGNATLLSVLTEEDMTVTDEEQLFGQPDGQKCHTNNKENKENKENKVNKVRKEEVRTPLKTKFSENVAMTEHEYKELTARFGEKDTKAAIEILEDYKAKSGKRYESDYRAILSWAMDAVGERKKGFEYDILKSDTEEEFERVMAEKMKRSKESLMSE